MPVLQVHTKSAGAALLAAAGTLLASAALAAQPARAGRAPQARAEARAATPATLRQSFVRLPTGVRLHVTEAGPADGLPVLFLHGYTDSWFSWAQVLDRLPDGVRAIVPTQRGHGDSERPACCYRLEDFADDAVALLDELNVERAAVVGHSMGSFVAQRIAVDRPDRVAKLVLVGSGSTLHTAPVLEFGEFVKSLADPVDVGFVREFQQSTVALPLPHSFLDGVIAESAKVPARVWRDVLAGLLAGDARDELQRITAPTLIIWGAEDAFLLRADQEALLAGIGGSSLLVYDGVGHAPHWETPERFMEDLGEFLLPGALRRAPDRFLVLDDVVLRYRDVGITSQDAVVLLHGYSGRLEEWTQVADSLAPHRRVIALDLRGFGRSRARSDSARFGKAMAADVVAMLDALAIERAHLIGFSMGSLVAATVAHSAPERVSTLTMLAPPFFADSAAGARTLDPHVAALQRGEGLLSFFRAGYPDAPEANLRKTVARLEAINDGSVLVEVLRQLGGLMPGPADDERIRAPVLVAVGTADPLADEGQSAVRRLQNARLVELPGGDHSATLRTPSWVAAFRELTAGAGVMPDRREWP